MSQTRFVPEHHPRRVRKDYHCPHGPAFCGEAARTDSPIAPECPAHQLAMIPLAVWAARWQQQ